jgi:hypothetical protein
MIVATITAQTLSAVRVMLLAAGVDSVDLGKHTAQQ